MNEIEYMRLSDSVILDTETTGLGDDAEVCEISIIDALTGILLLDTLVKPEKEIPAEAIAIHGISNEMVRYAPCFDEVVPHISRAINGRTLIIYNSEFDTRLMRQSYRHTANECSRDPSSIVCAMKWYAEYFQEPNPKGEGFKWQKLINAAHQMDVDTTDIELHRAKGDCELTRRLINRVNHELAFDLERKKRASQ